MNDELFVAVMVIALDGCFLDRTVHALDLTIRPEMPSLGQTVFNAVFPASKNI